MGQAGLAYTIFGEPGFPDSAPWTYAQWDGSVRDEAKPAISFPFLKGKKLPRRLLRKVFVD